MRGLRLHGPAWREVWILLWSTFCSRSGPKTRVKTQKTRWAQEQEAEARAMATCWLGTLTPGGPDGPPGTDNGTNQAGGFAGTGSSTFHSGSQSPVAHPWEFEMHDTQQAQAAHGEPRDRSACPPNTF